MVDKRHPKQDKSTRMRELEKAVKWFSTKYGIRENDTLILLERIALMNQTDIAININTTIKVLSMIFEGLNDSIHDKTKTIEIMKRESIADILRKFVLTLLLNSFFPRFFHSHDEIVVIIQDFIQLLSINRRKIVQTGYSPAVVYNQGFLNLIGNTYPTRVPKAIYELNQLTGERKKLECISCADRVVIDPAHKLTSSQNGILNYEWAGNDPEHAPLIKGLEAHLNENHIEGFPDYDIAWIENAREGILQIKIDMLRKLIDAFRSGKEEELWNEYFSTISTHFTEFDTIFLIHLESTFYGSNSLKDEVVKLTRILKRQPINPFETLRLNGGGLWGIFCLIWFYQQEIKTGVLSRLGEMLAGVVVDETTGRKRLPSWNYFDYLGKPERGVLDKALDEMWKEGEKFWALSSKFREFASKVIEDNLNISELPLNVTVKLRNAVELQTWVGAMAMTGEEFLNKGRALPKVSDIMAYISTSDNVTIKQFTLIPGLKFSEVEIVFISNDSIRITARSKSVTFHYAEIGFKDNRKVDQPNTSWELLRNFARNQGCIDKDSDTDSYLRKELPKKISNLKKQLKAIFPFIEDDPFHGYSMRKGYKAKFNIRDDSEHDAHLKSIERIKGFND